MLARSLLLLAGNFFVAVQQPLKSILVELSKTTASFFTIMANRS